MIGNLTVGLDIGGTNIRAGLVDRRGRVSNFWRGESRAMSGRDAVIKNIITAIDAIVNPSVGRIGVGIAGMVNPRTGVFERGAHFSPSVWGLDLKTVLRGRYRRPVSVLNDAQAFTLAEARLGAGRGRGLVVGLTLGTGVGGGIALDGVLWRGSRGTAGEFGHLTVTDDRTTLCRCGRTNHLEALVSGTVLQAALRRRQSPAVYWKKMGRALAIGLADILVSLDPDIIVVGGGLSKKRTLLSFASREVRRHLPFPTLAKTPIVPAKLGDRAAVIGAALAANEARPHHHAHPPA